MMMMGRKGWLWALAVMVLAGGPLRSAEAEDAPAPVEKKTAKDLELFQFSYVWNVNLTISAEDWAAMEPKNAGAWPPPPPGRRGPGGPGAPGAPAATQRLNFGPATFLMPSFMAGDQDKDGKLSEAEFTGLGDKWFAQWDKDKAGRINPEQLRIGLNATIAAADPNEGRPAGLNLQGSEGKRN